MRSLPIRSGSFKKWMYYLIVAVGILIGRDILINTSTLSETVGVKCKERLRQSSDRHQYQNTTEETTIQNGLLMHQKEVGMQQKNMSEHEDERKDHVGRSNIHKTELTELRREKIKNRLPAIIFSLSAHWFMQKETKNGVLHS